MLCPKGHQDGFGDHVHKGEYTNSVFVCVPSLNIGADSYMPRSFAARSTSSSKGAKALAAGQYVARLVTAPACGVRHPSPVARRAAGARVWAPSPILAIARIRSRSGVPGTARPWFTGCQVM
jgi:hypothetical protein